MALSHTAALVLHAIAAGDGYGFSVMELTGLTSGTMYPALRGLERDGMGESHWEDESIGAGQRPARKYYRLTAEGKSAQEASVKRYPLLARMSGGS